jgi:precorrin-6A synthase
LRIAVVGVGMGPQHVTPEAAEALRASDYVVAAEKGPDDPLLEVRRAVAAAHGLPVVALPDPRRDRTPPDYADEVRNWHAARVGAWSEAITARDGDPAFLVWGDPSLYDSTIRVVDDVAAGLGAEVLVVPGISAPSLLAARFGIVLHEVGDSVHVTTARRLAEAVAAGQRNIVVMLTARLDLAGLEEWTIWWGANLGMPSEVLVHGRVGDVLTDVEAARRQVKERAGWVMDVYLLRAP